MEKLGTSYGGWFLPIEIKLNENSIIYSGGVGEDISFDVKLIDKYNCNILLIDPTKKAIQHFKEYKDYVLYKKIFNGNIQPDYYNIIEKCKHNIDKIKYINIGLWNEKTTLKFYKQNNQNYVSQSLINGMFSKQYDIVNVDTIKNIMIQNNHKYIDLLKLDIEGAEIKVLNKMLDDRIYPKYLCIEFDLYLKKKDTKNETKKIINRLINNQYKILKNDNYNITFKHIIQ